MSARRLVAAVATSALALGSLVGCTANNATHTSSPAAQQNPLAKLVSDVTGSLRKAADTDVRSVAFTMTMTADGVKANGNGVIAYKPLAMELDVNAAGVGDTTVRFVNNTVYLKLPSDRRAAAGGKTWLKLDAGKDSPFSSLSHQVQNADPTQQIKTLLASGKAVAVGQETIDGVPTVHYKVTTSVDTAIAQVDPEYRSAVKDMYQKAGIKQVTTEVWIDAQYRPHRAHVVAGSLVDTTVDYHDYNKPVHVAAPPAGDTQDMDALLHGLGR